MIRALVVDDQRGLRRSLALLLENAGMRCAQAASGAEALECLAAEEIDVVITDLRMDGMSGTELLREIRNRHGDLPVILITAYGTVESAVEAMRLGAYDYLTKPFKEQDILEKVREACALRAVAPTPESAAAPDDVVAVSPEMRAVLIRVERLAQTNLSVLITGETGTGKSRFARLIHDCGARRAAPFVSVNCASVPEQLLESELFGHVRGSFTGATQSRSGLFEAANGGTIFLDEIDTLSPGMQAKLLSVLQDREIRPVGSNRARAVDVRVISAGNQDLRRLMDTKEFRADLFYRINGVRLHLPPLRERREDIPALIQRFLAEQARRQGGREVRITPEAMERVLSYDYPGNIRQLESIVEQMFVFADEDGRVDMTALPEELLEHAPGVVESATAQVSAGGFNLAATERAVIEAALRRFDNLADVARELGIGRTTLWRKLRQYQLARGADAGEDAADS